MGKIRNEHNISQNEAAIRAGMTRQYYCNIENGARGQKLPISTAKKIAKALNLTLDELWEYEKEYLQELKEEAKKEKARDGSSHF
jgi:DNA-binding XRE family transcriptional regulator